MVNGYLKPKLRGRSKNSVNAARPLTAGSLGGLTTASSKKRAAQVAKHGNETTAIEFNSTGDRNTATGAFAVFSNTTGGSNTANASQALVNNTTGNQNTANGFQALLSNTVGDSNAATGNNALVSNTEGDFNTATGDSALHNNTTGSSNTANGASALPGNTTGNNNTAAGFHALTSNSTGDNNTAIGVSALLDNTTASNNTGVGVNTLFHNTTGSNNIALGVSAGENLTTGNNNIDRGNEGVTAAADTIGIGDSQTKTFIAGIREITTGMPDAINVVIDSAGQLGTVSSSKRFKHNIKGMDCASEAIHALKPVTFHYKNDASGTPQFGLIAEEVAEVNPNL